MLDMSDEHAILTDHSSLNSIARLLANTSHGKTSRAAGASAYYGYVYHYSSTIDVACLGDFIETLLSHETIYFLKQSGNDYRWQDELLKSDSVLQGIIKPLEMAPDDFKLVNDQSLAEIGAWREQGGLKEFSNQLLKMIGGVFDPRVFTPSPWADVAISLRDSEESDQFGEFARDVETVFLKMFSHMRKTQYHGFDNAFENFVRLMFTLCFRASLYKWTSAASGLPYAPYVVRAPLVLHSLMAPASASVKSAADMAAGFVERLRNQTIERSEEVSGVTISTFTSPVFLPYLVKKYGKPFDVIRACVDLRLDPDVVAFRNWVGETNQLISSEGVRALNSMTQELERCGDKIQRKLGLDGRKISISLGPISFELNVPSFVERVINPSIRRHLVFLRDVADSAHAVDDAQVWNALGLRGLGFSREQLLRFTRAPG